MTGKRKLCDNKYTVLRRKSATTMYGITEQKREVVESVTLKRKLLKPPKWDEMRQQEWQQGGRHSLRCIVDEDKQGGAQLEQKGQGGILSLRGPEESKKVWLKKTHSTVKTYKCKGYKYKVCWGKVLEVIKEWYLAILFLLTFGK